MAEIDDGTSPPPPQQQRQIPPMISLPPQIQSSSFQPLFSPGPITLLSNFFSDYYYPEADSHSFSQLLAGAMASPASQIPPASLFDESKQPDSGGFKQNRPKDLVIAQSPSGFMFPPAFSPSGFLNNSPGFLSPLQSPFGMSHQQALAHVTSQAAAAALSQSQSYSNNIFQPEYQPSEQHQMVNAVNEKSDLEDSQTGSPDDLSDVTESQQMVSVYADTNDGYNWRKYGQKQVKEHPRSYYKCSHVNCTVKKLVGQSLDGHVTDIVYKGQHNHDPPQPGKRARDGGDVNKPNNYQQETRVVDKPVADQGFNQLVKVDEPDDEPNPKRRNTEVGPGPVSRNMVSESKIVVQTRSEVDLLDDGFKWRKYGQKVVKGNTNPRSYYKCTFAGCNVRKHVERAPLDPKSVVTTYEGKHNHDIPVSKHRGYINKPPQRKEANLGNNERPVLLQMKEEAITV